MSQPKVCFGNFFHIFDSAASSGNEIIWDSGNCPDCNEYNRSAKSCTVPNYPSSSDHRNNPKDLSYPAYNKKNLAVWIV